MEQITKALFMQQAKHGIDYHGSYIHPCKDKAGILEHIVENGDTCNTLGSRELTVLYLDISGSSCKIYTIHLKIRTLFIIIDEVEGQNIIVVYSKQAMKNKMVQAVKYALNFNKYFDLDLKDFVHPVTGFKLIKFDRVIDAPDGVSLHNTIKNRYGKDATSLINTLKEL